MAETENDEWTCELCGQPLQDGETVIQIVRDRHPTYDREIVLQTFDKKCWKARTCEQTCGHCGCSFRITLLQRGDDYQNLSRRLLCPFCGTRFDSQVGFEA